MSDQHIFSIAPLEMARDRRLGAPHLRILLALLSFRNKAGNLVWPKRERLSEITGYTVRSISRYTRELVSLGWLEKDGSGGRSMAVRYRIIVPEIDAETLSDPETVSDPGTVSNPDTKTLSYSDRGIEQTNEQTNIPPLRPPPSKFRPPTVEEVSDYLAEQSITAFTAEQFWSHYAATGWMRGKTKIKNWKACVRTWVERERGNSHATGSGNHQRHESNHARVMRIAEEQAQLGEFGF